MNKIPENTSEEYIFLLSPKNEVSIGNSIIPVHQYSAEYFEKPATTPVSVGQLGTRVVNKKLNIDKTLGYITNGEDNARPDAVCRYVKESPIVGECLDKKRTVLYGGGVKYGYKTTDQKGNVTYKAVRDTRIDLFFKNNSINKLFLELMTDFEHFDQATVELILSRGEKQEIVEINEIDYNFIRFEEQNPSTKKIENIFINPNWVLEPNKNIDKIPLLDKRRPTTDILRRLGREFGLDGKKTVQKLTNIAMTVEMATPGHSYYPIPSWWSAITSKWLDFARKIPIYKDSIMANQAVIKYHVQYPINYFPDLFRAEGLKTKEAQEARRTQELADMKKYLKGVENAGSTVITYYKQSPDGKRSDEIIITVLDNKFKGGEYIDDSHEASSMIYTAMGWHPSLSGVIPGKTSSNLSGSDKRELLRIAQTMSKMRRDQLLSILYLVKEVNGWDENIEFYIEDIILTTLDSGREVQTITQ